VSGFKDIERVIDVDFWGVVNGTKAFLPHLIASGDGHVVNISSMFGLFAIHGQAPYHAAKFAVRGFTEALRQEMKLSGHPVNATCVHPGYIKTDIVRNMASAQGVDTKALIGTFDKIARTSPERVARTVLNAVAKNKARVLPGVDAKMYDLLVRLTGSGYMRILMPINRRLSPPTR
jgi:NAD(P)-dependent dehydrogenase (short-subunit alcohol dehydrogenase family)